MTAEGRGPERASAKINKVLIITEYQRLHLKFKFNHQHSKFKAFLEKHLKLFFGYRRCGGKLWSAPFNGPSSFSRGRICINIYMAASQGIVPSSSSFSSIICMFQVHPPILLLSSVHLPLLLLSSIFSVTRECQCFR